MNTLVSALCVQRRRFCAGMMLCLCLIFALPIHSQTSGAGTINGTVMDSSHAVVPGASIMVINADTGIAHAYAADSAGLYVAPFLQPGHYKVRATAGGFSPVEATNLT